MAQKGSTPRMPPPLPKASKLRKAKLDRNQKAKAERESHCHQVLGIRAITIPPSIRFPMPSTASGMVNPFGLSPVDWSKSFSSGAQQHSDDEDDTEDEVTSDAGTTFGEEVELKSDPAEEVVDAAELLESVHQENIGLEAQEPLEDQANEIPDGQDSNTIDANSDAVEDVVSADKVLELAGNQESADDKAGVDELVEQAQAVTLVDENTGLENEL